jgi:pyrimidine-nucleoside phosphorylase
VTAPRGLRAADLIELKRDGGEVDAEALRWLVEGYVQSLRDPQAPVSEGQMAAFLMAGVLRGFTEQEAAALTDILLTSGDVLDLSSLPGPTVDKHSTGGVGDGTTLLVAPLLASCGAHVVKLSGRGLGHTGGTLDKLEAIPGFRVDLTPQEMLRIGASVGCVVAAQSERLVPADRALYALRDVTGTVADSALIASSVISKKLASGAETIVLDVKVGNGAFMGTTDDARELARLCVRLATAAGRRCAALVTAMDAPLGSGIGNALEVAECVELLQSPPAGRLAELSLDLAALALTLARGGQAEQTGGAREELTDRWRAGAALERLRAMVEAQGGAPAVCDTPRAVLPQAPVTHEVLATATGHVESLQARGVGATSGALGAGRARKQDPVDPAVGIELHVAVGDEVGAGDRLATIHARSEDAAAGAEERLRGLLTFSEQAVPRQPTVLELVS